MFVTVSDSTVGDGNAEQSIESLVVFVENFTLWSCYRLAAVPKHCVLGQVHTVKVTIVLTNHVTEWGETITEICFIKS